MSDGARAEREFAVSLWLAPAGPREIGGVRSTNSACGAAVFTGEVRFIDAANQTARLVDPGDVVEGVDDRIDTAKVPSVRSPSAPQVAPIRLLNCLLAGPC